MRQPRQREGQRNLLISHGLKCFYPEGQGVGVDRLINLLPWPLPVCFSSSQSSKPLAETGSELYFDQVAHGTKMGVTHGFKDSPAQVTPERKDGLHGGSTGHYDLPPNSGFEQLLLGTLQSALI